jgi:hypothetical protein
MKYIAEQWAEAKEKFVAAVNKAINARSSAAQKIKAQCGQDLGCYNAPSPDVTFITQSPYNHCAYGRQPTLAGIWGLNNLSMQAHWDISLSALRKETEELGKWATPEAWESAWADEQTKRV